MTIRRSASPRWVSFISWIDTETFIETEQSKSAAGGARNKYITCIFMNMGALMSEMTFMHT